MDEELIEAYDNFIIGNFAACVDIASRRRSSSSTTEFNEFLWQSLVARCHLGLGHMDAVRDMARDPNPALASTGYMAVLTRAGQDTQRRAAFDKLMETAAAVNNSEPVTCYYATIARAIHGDLIDAINYAKAVSASSPSEFNALTVQFSLAIHRPDLAEDILKNSTANRDDSAANKLVSAMFNLITNKHTDAYLCYSDLISQFSAESSLALTNGRAIANIQRSLPTEAQEDLELALATRENDPDTLANLVCAIVHQGKPSAESRAILSQLAQVNPNHPLVKRVENLRGIFQH